MNSYVDGTAQQFVCTRPFFTANEDLPANTVIIVDSGYRWRSDCWIQHGTTTRPARRIRRRRHSGRSARISRRPHRARMSSTPASLRRALRRAHNRRVPTARAQYRGWTNPGPLQAKAVDGGDIILGERLERAKRVAAKVHRLDEKRYILLLGAKLCERERHA